jgi:hypothetical protein
MSGREIKVSNPKFIGHFYWLNVPKWHELVTAMCIDENSSGPKRMRVQNGDHQGEAVQPHEYQLMERDDELAHIFARR